MEGGSFPEAPKGWVVQRYKFGWRLLCISNLALGAYVFSRTPKKEKNVAASKVETKARAEPVAETSTPPPENIVVSPPIPEPVIKHEPVIEREPVTQHVPVIEHVPVIKHEHVIEHEPITAYQQKELFKWMLEEKKKIKPNNREEEERINEEKSLLEQYIRTMSFAAHMFTPKLDESVVANKVESKAPEDIVFSPSIPDPVIKREIIPAYQQQEIFKWILEEKKKIRPKNREEEKRIDEEKALLEQYIRLNSTLSI